MESLWDLGHTLAKDYLRQFTEPWQALGGIGAFLEEIMQNQIVGADAYIRPRDDVGIVPYEIKEYREVKPGVWVHESAEIAPSAVISPPCIIGANTQVRQGAFLRGSVLVGDDCVVGNSVEIKNAILFDGVQVPHFNYVGDSILGHSAHFGAGAVTSNVRGDKGHVKVDGVDTGRKKVGAFVGDFAEIGCNAVLNPGTVIGRNSQVYPTACVRGVVPENSIYKNNGSVVKKNA